MKHIKLILFLLCFTSIGCSCEKQMHKLTYKCPELFEPKIIESVVVIPEYQHDTTFIFTGMTDTLIIEKERVEVRLIRSIDTLKTFITVPADTIIKEVIVEVPKPVIEKQSGWTVVVKVLSIMLAFIIIMLVIVKSIERIFSNNKNM